MERVELLIILLLLIQSFPWHVSSLPTELCAQPLALTRGGGRVTAGMSPPETISVPR